MARRAVQFHCCLGCRGRGGPSGVARLRWGLGRKAKCCPPPLRSTEHPRPRSALAASLPCSSRSLRRPSTSGWGAGPSTLLVFGVLGLWPRPHPQSFWFRRLVRWEPRDYRIANIALGTCLVRNALDSPGSPQAAPEGSFGLRHRIRPFIHSCQAGMEAGTMLGAGSSWPARAARFSGLSRAICEVYMSSCWAVVPGLSHPVPAAEPCARPVPRSGQMV